ncbi:MAG TPA: PRC-barrel domain-containing protein [Vineibacter sp.]|nr:PRC-barrel domain-containing protein [Vineibacter sp.]
MAKTQSARLEQNAESTSSAIIAADKVEGTNVYNRTGDKLGTVDHVMIDKSSGKVCYAIMSFGGFLGMGESYHPLPWQKLTYDQDKGGFVVDLDKRQLEGAPYHKGEDFVWSRDYGRRVDQYYGLPTSYWL